MVELRNYIDNIGPMLRCAQHINNEGVSHKHKISPSPKHTSGSIMELFVVITLP